MSFLHTSSPKEVWAEPFTQLAWSLLEFHGFGLRDFNPELQNMWPATGIVLHSASDVLNDSAVKEIDLS